MALKARLCLLGGFRLELDGQTHPVPASARRLLALLAVAYEGRRASRGALAEMMRPDSEPTRATSTLRSVLWRLPRERGRALVLGDALDVWLNPDLTVDLWDAEAQARSLCAGEAPRVDDLPDLALLTQDLLPGWYDDWLAVAQESFRQQRLHALERGADLLCGAGRYHDALSAGLGAVRSEPLRESAHRRVIEVHLAEDNHAEALRQYDHYRRLLAQELGLAPSARIRSLVAPLLGRPVDLPSVPD
ncbi:DNA-binding SARP family transcriptional activator [Nocardioides cavernae]|uniref:DNA-binding SARP family transcriptional activator n=1 Tax=Nocardioides cavernae TaxID=1921566 RepID=A0A7Y9H452_9ACTN|nr:BTAD domain-containing putative transcriptional regulator [Nocardioides cavernae]NYE37609.1 DNA-binding SARP family transcriptional activator [Nocardioides cavernae]